MINEYGCSVPRFRVGDRVFDTETESVLIVCGSSVLSSSDDILYWLGMFGSKPTDVVCNRMEDELIGEWNADEIQE